MNAGPVFLGGLAYTGKTPLRIALGLHPDLAMTRKSHLWDRLAGHLGDLATSEGLDRALDVLAADPGARRLHPDPVALRAAFIDGPRTEARLFGLLHAQHAARQGKSRWGEQLGPIVEHAGALVAAFPGARLIHLVRAPVERYAASPHRGPVALLRETARWRRDARLARANAGAFPGATLVVRHEDLLAEPVPTLEEVCAWIGVDPTDAMRAAIVEQMTVAAGVRRGVHAAARAWIARVAAAEIRDLGYADGQRVAAARAGGAA